MKTATTVVVVLVVCWRGVDRGEVFVSFVGHAHDLITTRQCVYSAHNLKFDFHKNNIIYDREISHMTCGIHDQSSKRGI